MIESPNTTESAKSNFKAIRILCLALIVGASVFAVIIVVLNLASGPVMPDEGQAYKTVFLSVVAVVTLLCVWRAFRIYNKGITAIKNSPASLNDKLNQYRSVIVIYMALCEGPALFSIIIFFLIGDYIVLGVTGAMILAMLFRMPQRRKMTIELELNFQEQQQLE